MKPFLDVSEFHGPNEASEVKHVIEYQTGRRSFPWGPGGCMGETIPNTGGEHCGKEGYHEDVTQLLRPAADRPAEAADESENTRVKKNIQFEKNGKGLAPRKACQERVLFGRYYAALLPLLQSGEYGHAVLLLRPLNLRPALGKCNTAGWRTKT